jgi:hypothetical protein
MDSQEMAENFTQPSVLTGKRGLGTIAGAAAVIVFTGVTTVLPLSTLIQQAAYDRFHLLSDSFPEWYSPHQMAPNLYRLEHQYRFKSEVRSANPVAYGLQ